MNRIAVLLVLALVVPASAPAVPILVPYSGRLSENSQPVEGTRDITVRIYDVASGGAALYTETFGSVQVSSGVFHVVISPPSNTWSGQDRWVGVSINGGVELAPRTRIGSVPYALTANESFHTITADALVVPLSSLVTLQGPGLPDVRNNSAVSAAGAWYVVPGRTVVFTKLGPTSRLRVTYQDTLGSWSKFYDGCEWRILLDGAEILYFSDADIEGTTESWHMSNAAHVAWATAAAGAHTIIVQNRGSRGAWNNGTNECMMGWNTRGNFVSVEEIP